MNVSRIIFITSDPHNPVIVKLILALSSKRKVLVLSDVPLDSEYPVESYYFAYKYGLFSKILALFYSPSQSRQEQEFPKRNDYRKFKSIINFFFYCKKGLEKFAKLPSYSQIYWCLFKYRKIDLPVEIKSSDVCVTDSNLRHVYRLIPAIVKASIYSKHLVALLYSWDNSHYSSITTFADSYLVWNKTNKEELINWLNIPKEKIKISGSLLHDYLFESDDLETEKLNYLRNNRDTLRVIYASVISPVDTLMASHEVRFILKLGRYLHKANSKFKLLFRAYPSQGKIDVLQPLRDEQWIEIYEDYNFISIPRLGNDNEKISFNDDTSKKIRQFFETDILLSTGSTYTLEFAFSGLPIIHLDPRKFSTNESNNLFFRRLALYGHLDILSNTDFKINLPHNLEELYFSLSHLDEVARSGYSGYLREIASVSDKELSRERVVSHIVRCTGLK